MSTAGHRVNVVRITDMEKHPNADSLSIVRIGGYQCVVKTENYKVGDLAVYIQPDSVVPEIPQFAFLWEGAGIEVGVAVPVKRRRITVRKFRKEWSEGLLMPLDDFNNLIPYSPEPPNFTSVKEGDDVAGLLGITHYEPEENTGEKAAVKMKFRWPRTLKGWKYFFLHFFSFGYFDYNGRKALKPEKGPTGGRPEYDVEAYKNYHDTFNDPTEVVIATEKIHGSNARYTFQEGKQYAGSHYTWKHSESTCLFRKALLQHPWIGEWCQAHEGYTLYGEVGPSQTGFNYGVEEGDTFFRVFDILDSEGHWVPNPAARELLNDYKYWVPTVFVGPVGSLLDHMWDYVDGSSMIPKAINIREGIVVKPLVERHARGLGRVQLKIVSNKYLEKA